MFILWKPKYPYLPIQNICSLLDTNTVELRNCLKCWLVAYIVSSVLPIVEGNQRAHFDTALPPCLRTQPIEDVLKISLDPRRDYPHFTGMSEKCRSIKRLARGHPWSLMAAQRKKLFLKIQMHSPFHHLSMTKKNRAIFFPLLFWVRT